MVYCAYGEKKLLFFENIFYFIDLQRNNFAFFMKFMNEL
jgi:hypothetical protein